MSRLSQTTADARFPSPSQGAEDPSPPLPGGEGVGGCGAGIEERQVCGRSGTRHAPHPLPPLHQGEGESDRLASANSIAVPLGVLAILLCLLVATTAAAQPIAITGGRVVTNGPDGIIETGTVLIQDGRIAAVGANIPIPDGATVIDAAGKWVTPGLFSAAAEIGIVDIDAETSTDDRTIAPPAPFSIAIDAADGFNPFAPNVGVARGDGVTRAALVPSSATGLFAGQGAIIDTSGTPASVTRPAAFIAASLSRGSIALAGGSRGEAFAVLEAALDDAAAYPDLIEDGRGEVLAPRDAEALAAALNGGIPIVIEANRASDLRALARLATERAPLRLIVAGGGEAHLAADDLAAARVGVILDPSLNLPYGFDRLAASVEAAGVLREAGVEVAIASLADPYANVGYMTQHAGVAVAHGLDWNDAFDALTGAPARMFGLESELGSLEAGKLADVVIWDGDPLEVMSGAERVFIAGVEYPARSRQSDLRDRYLTPLTVDDLPHAYRQP